MSMYVVTHKAYDEPKENGYRTILAGSFRGHIIPAVYDDEGDNISSKNPNYCELTAVYWLWKNSADDHIGICHYRRFFSQHFSDQGILQWHKALKLLDYYDIILPQKAFLKKSVKEDYLLCGHSDDLDVVEEILAEKCPEYVADYNKFLSGKRICYLNMMICDKKTFDSYCSWLFPILFELESIIDISGYDSYQQRIFGFISERLLNVWVIHNGLRAAHIFITGTEPSRSHAEAFVYRAARASSYALALLNAHLKKRKTLSEK